MNNLERNRLFSHWSNYEPDICKVEGFNKRLVFNINFDGEIDPNSDRAQWITGMLLSHIFEHEQVDHISLENTHIEGDAYGVEVWILKHDEIDISTRDENAFDALVSSWACFLYELNKEQKS